jgi:hypothetical protein
MKMPERTFHPLARGLGLAMIVLLASCGTSVSDRFPTLPGDPSADPHADLEVKGEESAMVASASCGLSFVSAPPVDPLDDPGASCPCTRRQGGPDDATACVHGADWGVTATIGPEGGNVVLRTTPYLTGMGAFGVVLRIPPNALAQPTTIRIVETSVPPPSGFADAAPTYVFEPLGLRFATPALLEMPWMGVESSSTQPILYWSSEADPCQLEPIAGDRVDFGFNWGTVTRLGWAAIGRSLPATTPACP